MRGCGQAWIKYPNPATYATILPHEGTEAWGNFTAMGLELWRVLNAENSSTLGRSTWSRLEASPKLELDHNKAWGKWYAERIRPGRSSEVKDIWRRVKESMRDVGISFYLPKCPALSPQQPCKKEFHSHKWPCEQDPINLEFSQEYLSLFLLKKTKK
jgi:hypothetical protein